MGPLIQGRFGISAKVICHSISLAGVELVTFEITYPRIILAELNTHRMLSKNSSSSRAIPFQKMKESLYGRPVRFGQANPGMQDKGEEHQAKIVVTSPDGDDCEFTAEEVWEMAKKDALFYADVMYKAGFHKQVYNRMVEPYQMMKTVISGTEWPNFFWLRKHGAADPSFEELASVMYEAKAASTPRLLRDGEWHLPYIDACVVKDGKIVAYALTNEEGLSDYLTTEEAIRVSAARTAAVSFRNIDYGVAKSEEVHGRLVNDDRIHGSALEHQATPMKVGSESFNPNDEVNLVSDPDTWEPGVTHMDKQSRLWSGNFRDFIQYRKLIPGENHDVE